MSISGRKPKPTKLHELEGTGNITRMKRRLLEPIAPGDLAEHHAPQWMSKSQRKQWDYAIQHAPKGVLKRIDRDVLVVWVTAADRHAKAQEAQNFLDSEEDALPGIRWDSHNKRYGLSPLIRVIEHSASIMLKAAEKLGFTPTARPRLASSLGEEELMVPGEGKADEAGSARALQNLITHRPIHKSN